MESQEKYDKQTFSEPEKIKTYQCSETERKEIDVQPGKQNSSKLVKEESGKNNVSNQGRVQNNIEKDKDQHLQEKYEGVKSNPLTDQKIQKLLQYPKFREIFAMVDPETLQNEQNCQNNFPLFSNPVTQFDQKINKKLPMNTRQAKMYSLYNEIKLMTISNKSQISLPLDCYKPSSLKHNSNYRKNYYRPPLAQSKQFPKMSAISPKSSIRRDDKTYNPRGFNFPFREDTRFSHYANMSSTYYTERNRNKMINMSNTTNLSSLMSSFPDGYLSERGYASETFYENKKSEIKSLINIVKESRRLPEKLFQNEKDRETRGGSNVYGNNIYTQELQRLTSRLFSNEDVIIHSPHKLSSSVCQYIGKPGKRKEPRYRKVFL